MTASLTSLTRSMSSHIIYQAYHEWVDSGACSQWETFRLVGLKQLAPSDTDLQKIKIKDAAARASQNNIILDSPMNDITAISLESLHSLIIGKFYCNLKRRRDDSGFDKQTRGPACKKGNVKHHTRQSVAFIVAMQNATTQYDHLICDFSFVVLCSLKVETVLCVFCTRHMKWWWRFRASRRVKSQLTAR